MIYDKLVVVNHLWDKDRVLKELGLEKHPNVLVMSKNQNTFDGLQYKEVILAPGFTIDNDRQYELAAHLEYESRKSLGSSQGHRPTVAPRKETTELTCILSDISLSVSNLVEKVLDRNETYYEAKRELIDLRRSEHREDYEKSIIDKVIEVVTRRALNQKNK